MSDFYDDLLEGYDQVEASSGAFEPIPAGWYPCTIEKVLEKKESDNKVSSVRMQLVCTEGPFATRRTWISISLNASPVDTKTGKARTPAEFKVANDGVKGKVKQLLESIDVPRGTAIGDGSAKVFNFYNVDAWEGRSLMCKLKVQPEREYQGRMYDASNQLAACASLADPKHGLNWWRATVATASTKAATPGSTMQEI